MKVYPYNKENERQITKFNSNFKMNRIAKTESASYLGMVVLEPGEVIWFHQAVIPQILLVIDGDAWVSSDTQEKQRLTKGDIMSWAKGEGHETTTDSGLTALIVEAEGLSVLNNMDSVKS